MPRSIPMQPLRWQPRWTNLLLVRIILSLGKRLAKMDCIKVYIFGLWKVIWRNVLVLQLKWMQIFTNYSKKGEEMLQYSLVFQSFQNYYLKTSNQNTCVSLYWTFACHIKIERKSITFFSYLAGYKYISLSIFFHFSCSYIYYTKRSCAAANSFNDLFINRYTASQKHESTLLHSPYVCTERIFDSRPFIYSKIFLK